MAKDNRPPEDQDDLAARRLARLQAKAKVKAERSNSKPTNRRRRAPRCEAITKRGYPCRAKGVTHDPDTGKLLCRIHAATEEERKVLMAQARAIRGQHKLKPHELMRQVIESNPIAFMQPYLDALGIRVVMVPDPNDPGLLHPTAVMDPSANGATLYGVSKEGEVVISRHKDIEAQQRAAERLFDRVYGKPKQTNIIAGAATQDDPQLVPFDAGRQAEITAILEAATKPSHLPPNSQN